MPRRSRRWVTLVGLVLMAGSCSSSPSDADLAEAFVEASSGASMEQGQCVVSELRENLDADELQRQLDQADPTAEFSALQLDAQLACGMTEGIVAELERSFADANRVDSQIAVCAIDSLVSDLGAQAVVDELQLATPSVAFNEQQFRVLFACGETTAVREALEPQLVDQGTAPTDAPCVARELVETMDDDDLTVLLNSEITDAFYAKFFEAQEACGAVNG